MLTVKVIDSIGAENIYEAISVNARPNIKNIDKDRSLKAVSFSTPDGADVEVSGAVRVFVMNEHGKTVANYYLGTPEGDYSIDDDEE